MAMRKSKPADSAIMKLLQDHNLNMNDYAVHGIMNPGSIYHAKKRDVKRLSLSFFMRLSTLLNMPWYDVAIELLELQKQYPPQITRDKRHAQKGKSKDHWIKNEK